MEIFLSLCGNHCGIRTSLNEPLVVPIVYFQVGTAGSSAVNVFLWAIPGLFFVYFRSFQTNINTILQQINVKKCPSSIRRWDSNP